MTDQDNKNCSFRNPYANLTNYYNIKSIKLGILVMNQPYSAIAKNTTLTLSFLVICLLT